MRLYVHKTVTGIDLAKMMARNGFDVRSSGDLLSIKIDAIEIDDDGGIFIPTKDKEFIVFFDDIAGVYREN